MDQVREETEELEVASPSSSIIDRKPQVASEQSSRTSTLPVNPVTAPPNWRVIGIVVGVIGLIASISVWIAIASSNDPFKESPAATRVVAREQAFPPTAVPFIVAPAATAVPALAATAVPALAPFLLLSQ